MLCNPQNPHLSALAKLSIGKEAILPLSLSSDCLYLWRALPLSPITPRAPDTGGGEVTQLSHAEAPFHGTLVSPGRARVQKEKLPETTKGTSYRH